MLSCFGRSPLTKRKLVFGPLDTDEVRTMQQNWLQLCESRRVGQDILASLISNKPIFASFFGINGTQLSEMKTNEKFLIQARRIESLMDTTVTSIGIVPQETIKQFSRNVGKIHFYHGVNFSSENWIFFQCILKAELETLTKNEAWNTVVDIIVNEMKLGFFFEMKAQFEDKPSIPPSPINRRRTSKGVPQDPFESRNRLGQREAELCRQSWNEANETDIGMKILMALISSKPAFATHFGVDPCLATEEMQLHPRVKIQASRIQGLINTVIILYEAVPESKIQEICARIGETHFHKGVNFTADNWLVFKRVTIEQVVEATNDNRRKSDEKLLLLRRAWHALMALVVRSMKDGFLQAASSPHASLSIEN